MSDENTTAASEPSGDVCAAADALRRAKEEVERAHVFYEHVREQAASRLKDVRKTSVGDLFDGTLKTVRRYPGVSLTVAAALGFMLGRVFRR